MSYTIQEIAEALGAKALGAIDLKIDSVAEPAEATASQLALAMKPEFAAQIAAGQARAAMLWEGADWESLGLEAAIFSRMATSPHPSSATTSSTSSLNTVSTPFPVSCPPGSRSLPCLLSAA